MVRSDRFTEAAIMVALERGDFHASTGVELAEYVVTDRAVSLRVKVLQQSRYHVSFIGRGGKVLKDQWVTPVLPTDATSLAAVRRAVAVSYEWKGDEGYVRAKIVDSNGLMAWTQPVLIPGR